MFDLLYTLAHPGTYPGGVDRIGWLAALTGVDETELRQRWGEFEPVLESGAAGHGSHSRGPEIDWVAAVASDLGQPCSESALRTIRADWDLTRRTALRSPHPSALPTLEGLRRRGLRVGVLSNTHAMEIRAWPQSPLAGAVDAVAFSHLIGHLKPEPAAYRAILSQLGAIPEQSMFVGDGGSGELAGARNYGFALVVVADEAPRTLAPHTLPELRRQAHTSMSDLSEVPALL